MVIRKVNQLARLYVRAWRVRLPDIPRGGARDVVLSTIAPSGGTGSVGLHAAKVSESPATSTVVEEACRRSPFYIAEIVRGRERWKSAPLPSRAEAKAALRSRARIYTAQEYQVDELRNRMSVKGNGLSMEIRIVKAKEAVA